MNLVPYGFYKVKDQYFTDFPSPDDRYMHNKSENRPYYLAVQDAKGIIWLLPLSTQVDKYKRKIEEDEKRYGECLKYYIMSYMGGERAVLIGNMIPVVRKYIKSPFTINSEHYVVKNEKTIKAIQKRVKKYLALVRRGKLKPYVDIMATEAKLLEEMAQTVV